MYKKYNRTTVWMIIIPISIEFYFRPFLGLKFPRLVLPRCSADALPGCCPGILMDETNTWGTETERRHEPRQTATSAVAAVRPQPEGQHQDSRVRKKQNRRWAIRENGWRDTERWRALKGKLIKSEFKQRGGRTWNSEVAQHLKYQPLPTKPQKLQRTSLLSASSSFYVSPHEAPNRLP